MTTMTTMQTETALRSLVLGLHDAKALKFGDFQLKSGISSPFYLDLRVIVSYPKLLQAVADSMWNAVRDLKFDVVCGVPYTAMPIATCLSLTHNIPLLMRRKEIKAYGTKQAIEGAFQLGQNCLVVEDLVTSGISVFETVQPLEASGLKVTDVVVLVDREQGGKKNIEAKGVRLHAVLRITDMLRILHEEKRVDSATLQKVLSFIASNQVAMPAPQSEEKKKQNNLSAPPAAPAALAAPSASPSLSYSERAQYCTNPVGKQLLLLMDKKKTNLCASADVTSKKELLEFAEQVGPHICMLKTHVDIITDFDFDTIVQLRKLAAKYGFLIFEDRKYADIGSTVELQYSSGIYKIVDWAHLVNAHTVPGEGIVHGLKKVAHDRQKRDPRAEPRALLLLAEMSSKGNLAVGEYTTQTVRLAEQHKDFVMGFISQRKLSQDPGLIYITPGVQFAEKADALGQQYSTPESTILERGCDVIVVGRGIYKAKSFAQAAKEYRDAGWKAYTTRVRPSKL